MNERDIFLAAIEIADPGERAAYVEEACGSDTALRAQVEELLKTHEETSRFLETPAAAGDLAAEQTVLAGSSKPDETSHYERSSGEAEFRQYLEPSVRPGWLGRLAHYEIEEILGRGSYGIVAKAFDEKLHRVVAIKLMSPELASTSPPRKRFLREARTTAAVTHENIVAIYAVEEEPIPYLVMEYIPGETLQQLMDKHGPLEVPDVLRIGRQVAAGLAAAHAVNLIHRDIKPSNILLSDGANERAKISDFGLARAVDDASLTTSGLIAGTPLYMAPEQARGEILDHRADLFSLGSVLYQMAGGRPPFRAANTVAVLKRVCEDTPRPLDDVIPGIPDWLQTIIFRLLEKDRDDRYQTAQEVADLLARCESELQHGGKVTCIASLSSAPESEAPKPEPEVEVPSPARKTPIGWLAGSLIAAAAVIGLLIMNGREKETSNREQTTAAGKTTANATIQTPANRKETAGWHGWPTDAPSPAVAPFDAEQSKAHQEAWGRYLGVPVEYENSIGMKLRLIPPGEYIRGYSREAIDAMLEGEAQEFWRIRHEAQGPQHRVILTKPFYLGVTEVTQSEYERVMDSNPSHFSATGEGRENVVGQDTARHPVENITWMDAPDFCARLSRLEQRKPFYFRSGNFITDLKGNGYRLPTAAEWEFACRAGTSTKYWIGDDELDARKAGWVRENSGGKTHPVGELAVNPFGLYDVHGNVREWVQDFWNPTSYQKYANAPAIDPVVSESNEGLRQVCGGDWFLPGISVSSLDRPGGHSPFRLTPYCGLRVALPVEAVKEKVALDDRADSKPASSTPETPASSSVDGPQPPAALLALRRDQISPEALAIAGNGDPENAPTTLVAILGNQDPIHTKGITSLAYSPDGRWLASSGHDQKILVRATATGGVHRVLKGHQSTIVRIAFSPDSTTLISGSEDGVVKLWSVDEDREPTALTLGITGMNFAVSPDGRFLSAGGNDGKVKLWKWSQWDTPAELKTEGNGNLSAITFSSDGEMLACTWSKKQPDGTIYLFKTSDGKLEQSLPGHEPYVYSLAFNPEGHYLASAGTDDKTRLWDLATGESTEVTFGGAVSFSPDGSKFVILNKFKSFVHSMQDQKTVRCAIEYWGWGIPAFSPDGKTLAVGDGAGATIYYDTAKWELKRSFFDASHPSSVSALAVSPDGKTIYSRGYDRSLRCWELSSPAHSQLIDYLDNQSNLLACSSDGRNVAAADRSLRIWRTSDGEQWFSQGSDLLSMTFSPDGKLITGQGFWDNTAHLWNAEVGKEIFRFPALKQRWNTLAFSPNGHRLATAGGDGTVIVWDVDSGKEVAHWSTTSVNRIAFRPKHDVLVTGHQDGTMKFWDTSNWQMLQEFQTLKPVQALKFTPDGKLLLSTADDGLLQIRAADQERPLAVIPVVPGAQSTGNSAVIFELDSSGRFLFASGPTSSVYVHRLPLSR